MSKKYIAYAKPLSPRLRIKLKRELEGCFASNEPISSLCKVTSPFYLSFQFAFATFLHIFLPLPATPYVFPSQQCNLSVEPKFGQRE